MTSLMDIVGSRKAALLLVALGKERAARILHALSEEEIEIIMSEIANLGQIDEAEVAEVMSDFFSDATARRRIPQGGTAVALAILSETLGEEKAQAVLTRIGGAPVGSNFRAITALDPSMAASMLNREHPQTIALVLSKLAPDRALSLLRELPDSLKGDVAYRIATLTPATPDVIKAVETGLERRILMATASQRLRAETDPIKPLIEILVRADAETEKGILERISSIDSDLAQDVRGRLFTIDDIVKLDDKAVQLVLREVDTRVLALALKGTSDSIKDKIFQNLSERARANLVEEIDLLGPQRMSDVEEARKEVIRSVRQLEQAGSIVLSRGTEDYVE